jgi:uncharacterized membrane protein
MTLLSQAKTLGGIGSLLTVLLIVPSVGWLLALAGFILVLIAVKYLSDALGDRSVFNNMIISVVAAIAGVVVAGVFIVAAVLSFAGLNMQGFNYVPGTGFTGAVPTEVVGFILAIILALVVVWVAEIVSAVFLRKSYGVIATKLNIHMFSTAALLYLIGAVLTIVLVGFIILFVAQILFIVAFFSLPEQMPMAGPSTQPSTV